MKPIVLEYWVDAAALGPAMGGGRSGSSSFRMTLQDLLSPTVSVTSGGGVSDGLSTSDSTKTTTWAAETELSKRISAIVDGTATEVMITGVGSWDVSDRPSPPLDLLIDWDTLHNAAPGVYLDNPAPKLRYPDLVLDRWPHAREMIAEGIYEPIGVLLKATAPDLVRAYPETMWAANAVDEEIYSLPVHTGTWIKYWAIRKDLREAAGVEAVATYLDLLLFAEALKRSRPLSRPLLAVASSYLLSSIMGYYGIRPALWDNRSRDSYTSYLLYSRVNDPRIRVLADTTDEEVLEAFDVYARLVGEGLVEFPRSGSYLQRGERVPAFVQGKWAGAFVRHGDEALLEGFRATRPDTVYEVFAAVPPGRPPSANYASSLELFIPARSPNKVRTLQLLNAFHTQEAYDFLQYGVEGTHWREEPGGAFIPLGVDHQREFYLSLLSCISALTPFPYLERPYAGLEGEQAVLLHDLIRKRPLAGSESATPAAMDEAPDLTAVGEELDEYRSTYHAVYRNLMRRGVVRGPEWDNLLTSSRDVVETIRRGLDQ